jgi:flagellar biosynthetic protein FlhB
MSDRSGKTEQPTQRRVDKARGEGQFPAAREFVGAMQFLVLSGLMAAYGVSWFAGFREAARRMLAGAFTGDPDPAAVCLLARQVFWNNLLPLAVAGTALAGATLVFRLATTRFGVSFKRLVPDAARFNPLARLRQLPRDNFPSAVQAMILLPLFSWAVYAMARDKLPGLLALPLGTVENGCAVLASSLMELFWKAAGLFLLFGSVDLFRQMRRYKQDLRMSRQEIREEMKDVEGNPQMKARIRRLQRDRARRRMMQEVPTATAVVVNPTHFAVALRYSVEASSAPVVVAKGKNYLAARIRAKAIEHGVPIVENPPLAQALYKSVDVGQEIPPQLYKAVAEILAYIFRLMNGRLPA